MKVNELYFYYGYFHSSLNAVQELTKVYYYIDLLCWAPSDVLSSIWNYTQERYKKGTFYGIEVERHIPLDSVPVRIHVNPFA